MFCLNKKRGKIMKPRVNEIDAHIGQRLRSLRQLRGFSQDQLAKRAGVSFQQIQKYENGKNRMGGSRIYQMGYILTVTPLYFFEGLPGIILKNLTISDPETLKIAKLFQNMDARGKRTLHIVAKSIVCR